jgi:hypothetical protein
MTVRSILTVLAVAAALSACAFLEEIAEQSSAAWRAGTEPVDVADVPLPARKPAPPQRAALTPPAAPAPAPATPPMETGRLEQLTPEQTVALFGEPTSRSERGSGVVWSYVRPSCELDLHFFMNVQTKVSRVLDYDLRAGDGSERSRQRCLEQLALERRTLDSGGSTRPR